MYDTVREVGVHGIWQTHLNMGHVQRQIKALDQKFLLIKWQLVIHKLFVTEYFAVGECSSETALCSSYASTTQITHYIVTAAFCLFDACCVFTS